MSTGKAAECEKYTVCLLVPQSRIQVTKTSYPALKSWTRCKLSSLMSSSCSELQARGPALNVIKQSLAAMY